MRRALLLSLALLVISVSGCRSTGKKAQSRGWTPEQKQLGTRALTVLRNAMDAGEPDLRVAAALAWGRIGNPAAVPLLRAALSDLNPEVRIAAARSLWKLGDSSGVAVVRLIAETDTPLNDPLQAMKAPVVTRARVLAVRALTEMLGLAAQPVLEPLETDADAAVRQAAGLGLLKLGRGKPETLTALITQATTGKAPERIEACRALALVNDPKALDALKRLGRDSDPDVRLEALDVLGAPGRLEALPEILEAIGDVDERLRVRAARSLARIRSRSAAPTLRALLHEPLPLKLYAWAGLQLLDMDPRPFIPGEAALEPDPSLKAEAAEALELAGAQGLEPLAALADDNDGAVRVRASAATLMIMARVKP